MLGLRTGWHKLRRASLAADVCKKILAAGGNLISNPSLYGANDQVVSRKMFGFQGRKDQWYLGNVNDLTDHLGSAVLKYRYDAFGGVFKQVYNSV